MPQTSEDILEKRSDVSSKESMDSIINSEGKILQKLARKKQVDNYGPSSRQKPLDTVWGNENQSKVKSGGSEVTVQMNEQYNRGEFLIFTLFAIISIFIPM